MPQVRLRLHMSGTSTRLFTRTAGSIVETTMSKFLSRFLVRMRKPVIRENKGSSGLFKLPGIRWSWQLQTQTRFDSIFFFCLPNSTLINNSANTLTEDPDIRIIRISVLFGYPKYPGIRIIRISELSGYSNYPGIRIRISVYYEITDCI